MHTLRVFGYLGPKGFERCSELLVGATAKCAVKTCGSAAAGRVDAGGSGAEVGAATGQTPFRIETDPIGGTGQPSEVVLGTGTPAADACPDR